MPNKVVFQKFNEYFDKSCYVDKVVFDYSAKTSSDLLTSFKEGSVDILPSLAKEALEELIRDEKWQNQIETALLLSTTFLHLQVRQRAICHKRTSPGGQLRHRQGRARRGTTRRPSQKPAMGILPPGSWVTIPIKEAILTTRTGRKWLINKVGYGDGLK